MGLLHNAEVCVVNGESFASLEQCRLVESCCTKLILGILSKSMYNMLVSRYRLFCL